MSLSTPTTPTAAGDTTSGTTATRNAVMPTVANGDGAILAFACAANVTATLVPEAGWTSPWVLEKAIQVTGKSLFVYKATNLSASDSGKNTQINTSSSVKVCRGILPIRGGSTVDIVDTSIDKDGGAGTSIDLSTAPLATTRPGCGAVHVAMIRRNDGVAGDAYTVLDEYPTGQSLTEELNAFTGTSTSTSSLSALIIASDWTPLASGATIPSGTFRADAGKPGSYLGVTLSIRPGNVAPVAYAGPDIEVDAGDTAHITAATATDADGTVSSTVWTWVSYPTGSAPTITGSTGLTPSFPTTSAGEYVLRLTVTDNNGATHTDDVSIWAVTTTPKIRAITSAGGYTAVGAASIVAALGDANPATYAQSSGNPVNDTLIGELEPIPAGAKSFTTTLVNDVDSPVIDAVLTLLNRDTGTTVATRPVSGITTTQVPVAWNLSSVENGLVLDSHKLNIRCVANVV